ncbi:hypothetical protein ABEW06_25575 [Peribacillus simplex]
MKKHPESLDLGYSFCRQKGFGMKSEAVAADAAYKTPAITNYLFGKEITPALPYTRPRTKEGFFRKHDY